MKRLLYLFCSVLLLLAAGCGAPKAEKPNGGKLPVVASFYAMKEITQAIGGDKVDVRTLIPEGTEPHEFQPTTRSMKDLSRARVLVIQGLGMEPWAEEMVKAAENKDLVQVVAAQQVQPIQNEEKEEIREHGQYDPHAWLSPSCAQLEARAIADGLAKADPANRAYYEANADKFIARLQTLEDKYKEKFRQVHRKDFVTGHAAFAYVCRDFGLEQSSVEGVFASGEPNARQLAALGADTIYIGDDGPSSEEVEALCRLEEGVLELTLEVFQWRPCHDILATHVYETRPEEAEEVIRTANSRALWKGVDIPEIPFRRCHPGDVTLDNGRYGRYAGELEICKTELPADKRVDVLGRIPAAEQFLLQYLTGGKKFRFHPVKIQ